jgi:hypothetical protein
MDNDVTKCWYSDWFVTKCVKDCLEDAADPECGRLAEHWRDVEFMDAPSCCQEMMPWKNLAERWLGHCI